MTIESTSAIELTRTHHEGYEYARLNYKEGYVEWYLFSGAGLIPALAYDKLEVAYYSAVRVDEGRGGEDRPERL